MGHDDGWDAGWADRREGDHDAIYGGGDDDLADGYSIVVPDGGHDRPELTVENEEIGRAHV